MRNVTTTAQQRPRKTAKKKKWRLSQKGKFRLGFIATLLILFVASYCITSWVLLSAPVAADPSEADPEAPTSAETSGGEGEVPAPITDPKLPHILTGAAITGNDEPAEEPVEGEDPAEGEGEPGEEDPGEEDPTEADPSETEPEGDPPNAENPSAGETTPPSETRNEGLR